MDTREQLELPESRSVSVTSDIAANVGGKIWLAALNLGFTPIYLTLLGVEAFGLIGFYSTLLIAFTLFDVGLSSTLNREMARSFHDPHGTELRRDLLKTLQAIYFLITVAMIVAAITGAGLIAHYWVKPDKLSPGTIEVAVQFMGIATAFQMLFAFYSGGLLGLRKQVLYNIVNAAVATLRFAGSVLVLFVFSRTVEAFFLWQAAVNAFGAVAIACILWRVIPRVGRRARFSCGLLSSNWRFAGGLWATTVAGFLLGQADKVVVSKIAS
ncbi:MAG: hypothetical protein M1541_21970, partial [Acidobacteria bacterium]|nr:hypothetical protein [Acidobacteriota bacterium]